MKGWPKRFTGRPWIYGHRGARGSAPENTILSFENALNEGADGVEFDVRLNFEGKVIVFHDESLERVTHGRDVRALHAVAQRDLRAIVLDSGASIPALADVLAWAGGNAGLLNIELKPRDDDASHLAAAVVEDILNKCDQSVRDRIVLSSFSMAAVNGVRELHSDISVALLLGPSDRYQLTQIDLSQLGVHPHYTLMDGEPSAKHNVNAAFVNVWTVNDTEVAESLNLVGVDGLISDIPRTIRDLFA